MSIEFKVDSSIKNDYLNNKPTKTAKSYSFIMKSVDDYEVLIGKPIYNMSHTELRGLIAMQFPNKSQKVIETNVSRLRTYIDFCIFKNVVPHGENRLATFTASDSKEFVNKQAILEKYITTEKLREYQNVLFNEQDKLLLELTFLGIRGRTTEDGTMEEIINLRIGDLDEANRWITVTQNNGKHRIIALPLSTIQLIKDTYNQQFYVENNGEMTANKRLSKPREMIINPVEDYVFRVPGKKKFEKFTPPLLNSRMKKIQGWVGNPYLTFTSVYMSGMIELTMSIYKEKGEVTKEDYIRICDKFNYGETGEQYYFVLKTLFEEYKELSIKG
jgi:integrase